MLKNTIKFSAYWRFYSDMYCARVISRSLSCVNGVVVMFLWMHSFAFRSFLRRELVIADLHASHNSVKTLTLEGNSQAHPGPNCMLAC